MQLPSLPHPASLSKRALSLRGCGILAAALVSQGFYCSQKSDPPSLATVRLVDIHLKMDDPGRGSPGVFLAWEYPVGGEVSYFEIYQSSHKDSLLQSVRAQAGSDSFRTVLPLPDSSRPFTLYYAVRAILVQPTGQKIYSDTLPVDSLTIAPSLNILQPEAGSYQDSRTLNMQVQTASDNGVVIRLSYFEKSAVAWYAKQDTCLPTDGCGKPIFGNSVQRDSLILEQRESGDTAQALFCVVGTESFQGQATGLVQSLGCTRFYRIGP